MPDVEIAGTGTTVSFPDSMTQDQILQVLRTHPVVRQVQQQAASDVGRAAGSALGVEASKAPPAPTRAQIDDFRMKFFNVQREDANIPMQAAVALSRNPSDSGWNARLAQMNLISQAAIREKAAELRKSSQEEIITPVGAMGPGAGTFYWPAIHNKQTGEITTKRASEVLPEVIRGPEGARRLAKAKGFAASAERFVYTLPDPEMMASGLGTGVALKAAPVVGKALLALMSAAAARNAYTKYKTGDKGGAIFDAALAVAPFAAHTLVKSIGGPKIDPAAVESALARAKAPTPKPTAPLIDPEPGGLDIPAYVRKGKGATAAPSYNPADIEVPAYTRQGRAVTPAPLSEMPQVTGAQARTARLQPPSLPDLSGELSARGVVPVPTEPISRPASYGPEIPARPSLQDWLDSFTGPEKPTAAPREVNAPPIEYAPGFSEPTEAPIRLDKAFRPQKPASNGPTQTELMAQYEPRMEALRAKLQAADEAVSADLKKTLDEGGLSAGVNPELFAKLAHLGAIKLAKGTLDFASWSAEMIRDVGEGVRPHLKRIWQEAKNGAESIKNGEVPLPAPAADPAVQKVRTAIEAITKLRPEQEAMYHEQRSQKAATASETLAKLTGPEAFRAARRHLSGKFDQPAFEPLHLTDDDILPLYERVRNYPPWEHFYFMKENTAGALDKLFSKDDPQIPAPHEVKLLEEVFGPEFVRSLDKSSLGSKIWRESVGALNLPRALMSSMDFSAVLRQAAIQTVRHPVLAARNLGKSAKAMFSESDYEAMQQELRTRPNAKLYNQTKLAIVGLKGRRVPLNEREEAFMSQVAEKIPWVRGSERAYNTYLNRMRADVFDAGVRELHRAGYTPDTHPEAFNGLAKWINMSTGRGTIPGGGEQAVPFLNNIFFAPRFMASRIGVLGTAATGGYATLPKPIRIMAMKDLASYSAVVLVMLQMAKMNGAKVETDPRSTDFGKIQVGKTRLDLLGGFQQWIRFAAQMITGQAKTPQGVEKRKAWDTVAQEVRKKLSPSASMPIDIREGKNVVGEKVTLKSAAISAVTPLAIHDMYEAISQEGARGAALSAPSVLGAGVQTYTPKSK